MRREFRLLVLGALAATATLAPTSAWANAGDVAATHAYIVADYKGLGQAVAKLGQLEGALQRVLHQVRSECPAAAGEASPQDVESEQLSNEVIGTMVTSALRVVLPIVRTALHASEGLHWSNPAVNGEVHAYLGKIRTMTNLAVPHLCADVRAWAASGFHTLPASTVAFDRVFMPSWVGIGEIPSGLARYEQGSDRELARKTIERERVITEYEARAVSTWGQIMDALVLSP